MASLMTIDNPLDRLKHLTDQQNAVIPQILQTIDRLASENAELKDQVELLKQGRKQQNEMIQASKDQIVHLHRQIRLQDGDPITICLLDGDGCIFTQEYLAEGEDGGKAAAASLKHELFNTIGGAIGSLWVSIYVNQAGLRDTLVANNICSATDFADFVLGFNRSTELFSIVDVGKGKEAADAKIREMLKTFAPVHQVKRIVFGGGHDAGYVTTLNSLKTNGVHDKIILLDYGQNARAIEILGIASISVTGLFRDTPLVSPAAMLRRRSSVSPGSSPRLASAATAAPASPLLRSKSTTPEQSESRVLSAVAGNVWNTVPSFPPKTTIVPKAKREREPTGVENPPTKSVPKIDRSKALIHQKPTICNDHYLHVCVRYDCPYSHEYDLTEKDLAKLRFELKQIPCKGRGCRQKDCWYRH